MKCRQRIALGMLFLGTFACADRDAELREEFQAAATALATWALRGLTRPLPSGCKRLVKIIRKVSERGSTQMEVPV